MRTLIVEDDASLRKSLETAIRDLGGEPRGVGTARQASDALRESAPHLLIVDISLPDGDGLEILREARQAAPDMDAIVITGSSAIDHAIEALRAGAADYLLKPLRPPQLEAVYQRVAERRRLELELDELRTELQETGRLGEMVGRSEAMQTVFESLRKVARTAAPVLISGASGSGKEVAARTIHRLSRRAGKPFVAFNCGAVSPTLIESELFGHERGSFTGADKRRVGYFEEANEGTLFLDEITEMSAELQVRLLRVLEEKSLRRVGGAQEIRVDVRLLSATNRDPEVAMREGKLREDLYYRLNVFPLRLPALKERREDIPILAEHFLREIDQQEKSGVKHFEPAAIQLLQARDWPGNVRELRNMVHRAYILTEGDTVREDVVRGLLPGAADAEREPKKAAKKAPPAVRKPSKPQARR
ncbi:MAG TPA: sigma-54 dependent transcriptional regulator [Thermoanaerobaculia bacterium]|nr:sigma-54 dependent transcriptional regulator [Thermoanaerobaculia bacterium]